MKRFRAYVDRGPGASPDECEMEFADGTPDQEITAAMDLCVQTLLENVDAGWYEVDENEPAAARGRVK